MDYEDFIKQRSTPKTYKGIELDNISINPLLFDFQKDIVKIALQKGKYAIFADCGLGKTFMQLEWAKNVHMQTKKPVLIVAPLAVSIQTIKEAEKLDLTITPIKEDSQIVNGINIINYEMLKNITGSKFAGVALDESSILKSYMGTTKQKIIKMFKGVPFKSCFTGTPSPNDTMELLNHASFLDVMESHECLAVWFINDITSMGKYRLKKHAVKHFWKWVSSWAISVSDPEYLGYCQSGYKLPKLNEQIIEFKSDITKNADGNLFRMNKISATTYHKEKKINLDTRIQTIKEIVAKNPKEIYLIWCDRNDESALLTKELKEYGAIEVKGSDKPSYKEDKAIEFANGNINILISKPKIFGFGMNFQVCHNVIYCGLSFSYESYYQSIRRVWRFGQDKEVNSNIVIADTEMSIMSTVNRKAKDHNELKRNMEANMNEFQELNKNRMEFTMDYEKNVLKKENKYEIIKGDCVEEMKGIDDESIHFQIFSPPFSTLYIYSDSHRDMGNSRNDKGFMEHFEYLIPELYRTLKSGRLCAVHCKNLVDYKGRDGRSGLRDFRGDIIRAFEKHNFKYHSEVCIWKDPVTEMHRTKAHGLLYKQLRNDSSYSRQGLPDYLVLFRKWGEEDVDPVDSKTKENFPLELWQKYASPVWFDIKQTNVLNIQEARADQDEKHICPLQLDVIERAVKMWTNPGDIVLSPFAGIGSEGYVSLQLGRQFVGIELKEEYFLKMKKNLDIAIAESTQGNLELGLDLDNNENCEVDTDAVHGTEQDQKEQLQIV